MEIVTVRTERDSNVVDYPGNLSSEHDDVPNHKDLSTKNTTLIQIPISPQDGLDEVLKNALVCHWLQQIPLFYLRCY